MDRDLEAFERAGAITASCEWRELGDPVYTGTDLESIPFGVRRNLEEDTSAYHLEVTGYYEDDQKCDVTVTVDGAGVMADEEGWFQGEETLNGLKSCYILNIQTGEKYSAGPEEFGWTREIAGFVMPSRWTLYWCPVGPMGDVNAMMGAGQDAVIASGRCRACPITVPK